MAGETIKVTRNYNAPNLKDVIKQMLEDIGKYDGAEIQTEFNGLTIVARPGDTEESIQSVYDKAFYERQRANQKEEVTWQAIS